MLRISIRTVLPLFLFAAACSAQAVHTPEKGSAQRAAILNALRVPVEKDLKQKITFVTDNFKVQGNWAFVSGEPQTPAGGKPSLKGTAWDGQEDMFDDNFFGLLKKIGGRWKVVKHALGCTDVCYLDWWLKYKAPKAIFPYSG
jgi:ketosteroid isomerase-like protein